jgi:hypothetical protein
MATLTVKIDCIEKRLASMAKVLHLGIRAGWLVTAIDRHDTWPCGSPHRVMGVINPDAHGWILSDFTARICICA